MCIRDRYHVISREKTGHDTSAISVRSNIEFSDLFWVLVLAALVDYSSPLVEHFLSDRAFLFLGRHEHSKSVSVSSLHKPWRDEYEHWCISASHQGLVALFGEDAEMYLNML